MIDDTHTAPVGASVWETQMYTYLTQHVRAEGAMLGEYVAAAESTDSKALAYLVKMLVEDERRHHQLFNDLAVSLKHDAELRAGDPVIPRLDLDTVDSAGILEVSRRLLKNERTDLAELKRLAKELDDVKDTTLWVLMVDIMMRDTKKHIAILKFVERHAKSPRSVFRRN